MTLTHGARRLPRVEVVSYNVELKDENAFLGDRASKGAFRRFIDEWRKPLRRIGEDPFGSEQSSNSTICSLRATSSRSASCTGRSSPSRESLPSCFAVFSGLSWKDADRIMFGGGFSAAASVSSPSAARRCC